MEPLKSSTFGYQDHESHLKSSHPEGRKSMKKHDYEFCMGQIWKSTGHILLLLKHSHMVTSSCTGDLTCTLALCSRRENGFWWAAFSLCHHTLPPCSLPCLFSLVFLPAVKVSNSLGNKYLSVHMCEAKCWTLGDSHSSTYSLISWSLPCI